MKGLVTSIRTKSPSKLTLVTRLFGLIITSTIKIKFCYNILKIANLLLYIVHVSHIQKFQYNLH